MFSNFAREANADAPKKTREFVSALRKDRASFLLSDIFRSLIFILIVVIYACHQLTYTRIKHACMRPYQLALCMFIAVYQKSDKYPIIYLLKILPNPCFTKTCKILLNKGRM